MQSRDLMAGAVPLPEHEMLRLAVAATGRRRSELLLGCVLTDDEVTRFDSFVARRLSDEPLQYIEGSVPFGPVEIHVDPRVLIPRPETEYMFEQAIGMVDDVRVVVDLCTGSGNLAIAFAKTFPSADVFAVDLSRDAAEVALVNAQKNGVVVNVLVGDLFDPLPGGIAGDVDVLVANPPYLAEHELADIPPDVGREPAMALVGGAHGDEIVARIAADADRWLKVGGLVVCEISEVDAGTTLGYFGHLDGCLRRDLTGRDRFVIGVRRVDYR